MTTRGRVVMLVDNDVRVDSRVQKEARSMAAAGWEIILLGERRDATLETWSIGDATVRLVPMENKLTYAPSTWRRSWVRRPFAYPPGRETAYKLELARARRIDMGTRLADLAAKRREGGSTAGYLAGKAALFIPRATTRAQTRWTQFRADEARRLREVRMDGSALVNRAPIWFWQATMGHRAWRKLDPSLWDWELAYGRSSTSWGPTSSTPTTSGWWASARGRKTRGRGRGPRRAEAGLGRARVPAGRRGRGRRPALAAGARSRTSGSTCRTPTPW